MQTGLGETVIACTLAIFLTGCNKMPWSARSHAHEEVGAQLIDGDSAKFRSEETTDGGAVCGEVNAKNRMGAYVGFTPYVYTGDIGSTRGLTYLSPGEPDFAGYFRYRDNQYMDSDNIKKVSEACAFVAAWEIFCSDTQKLALKDLGSSCKFWSDNKLDQLKAKLGIVD